MKLFLLGLLPALIYGYKCPSDTGLFSDPADCSKFYQCVHGQAYHKDCTVGTVVRDLRGDTPKPFLLWPAT